ncbi:hypothetical protein SCALM49S_07661 [Streptomyces californicus]
MTCEERHDERQRRGASRQVIRQDDGGGSYRVGRYATQAEAQQVADGLDHRHPHQVYRVERVGQRPHP